MSTANVQTAEATQHVTRVLIAVDEHTHEAALQAKDLFPDAEHLILSATNIVQLSIAEPFGGGIVTSGYSAETLLAAENQADDAVRAAQTIVGPDASTQVEVGEAGPVICEQAAKNNVDVVVVGRRSHSWVSRLFDPSVSEYVIQHAHCPVLVVNEPHIND
jgi:nucleotide-binding universal stress UspA family protein